MKFSIKNVYHKSIQNKIVILGALVMLLIAMVVIGYAANALYSEAFEKAEYEVQSKALMFGADMNAELSGSLSTSETLAMGIQGLFESGTPPTREQINHLLETTLKNSPGLFGVFSGFEPNAFDNKDAAYKNSKGSDETGRFVPYYFRDGNSISVEPLNGMDTKDYYQLPKITLKPSVTEPYLYSAGGKDVLMLSLTSPVIVDNRFIGVAGVDLELTSLNMKAEEFEMYDGQANLLLLTKGGMVVGENLKENEWVGKAALELPLETIGIEPAKLPAALEKAQKGEGSLYTENGFTKCLVPVQIGDSRVYWDIAVTVPEAVIGAGPFGQILILLLIGVILTIFGLVLLYLLARSISRPIIAVTQMANKFADGMISTELVVDQSDEVGQLARSFKRLGENLHEKEKASSAIAEGNLSIRVPVASDMDGLGIAMVQMKEAITSMVTTVQHLATSAEAGKLTERGDVTHFKGEYRNIIAGLNNTLDSVINPVNEAMRLSDSYAKGDFTDRVNSELVVNGDFIPFRDALNQIGIQGGSAINGVKIEVESLSATMEETNASAEEVASTTSMLARSSNEVSVLAERSGTGIQQTLTAMEDLSATVSSVAGKAEQASAMAKQTVDLSEKGALLAKEAEKGMEGIMQSVDETSGIITDITGQMEEIGKIVDVITGIAEQTGLLALNAAIEAARAGEAGLGFAVVADEVKSLALESQKSAENIAHIIGTLQKKSHTVSESMKTSAMEVQAGNKAVSDTLQVFTEIVRSINVVHTNMTEVAGATEEQAAAVEEITASVNEVGSLVQKTAKEAVDSAAATEEVTASIDQITKAITDAAVSVQKIAAEMDKFTTS